MHGRLEIDSSSTLVRIGEISVCLVGKEEMNDREIGFGNRVFLTARMQFQGDNRKSKAVFGKADSLGYWASTKGKTGVFNVMQCSRFHSRSHRMLRQVSRSKTWPV